MTDDARARKLGVIARLEAAATPTELAFLREKREQIERQALRAEPSPEAPATALVRQADRIHYALHRYRLKRSHPDLDEFWRAWIDDRAEHLRRTLEPVLEQLRQAGHDYAAPPYEPERLSRDEDAEVVEARVSELRMLIRLKRAWAERHGREEDARARIAQLEAELAELTRSAPAES